MDNKPQDNTTDKPQDNEPDIKSQDNETDNPEERMESGLNSRNCKPRKKRSTAEKYLCVFSVIFLLIFFVLLAVLLRPKGGDVIYNTITDKKCMTVTCVREAFRLLNNIDFSLDACEDFSKLVCKTNQDTVTVTSYKSSDANEDLLATIQELLEDQDENNEMESVSKARKFYHSCLNKEGKKRSTGNIVRELLRKANMTEDSKPLNNNYSREKTLALLIVYGNKNPFFKFRKTPQVIYLYPGSPVLKAEVLMGETNAHIIMRMKYKKLIFNALMKMDIREESASLDAEDMVKFEIAFAKLATTANCTRNSSEVALHQMEDMFPDLKWSVIVRYIFKYYNLENDYSPKLTMVISCEDYFRNIVRLMLNYDFRTLELFIMWSFALHYLPILDHTFRPYYREIEQVVENNWHGNVHDANWKICTYATMHYFNTPIAHLYYNKEHSQQTDKEIESLFKDIQSVYKEIICSQEWLDEKTATQCKTMIIEMLLVIGLPSNIRDTQLVDAMYSLVNMTDDVMENLLILDKAVFAENVTGTQLTPMYHTPMDADIYYDHGSLTILFGATLPPVFVFGAPRYMNYGWMGFIIAREIWKAIESLTFSDKAISPDVARNLHVMEECLSEPYFDCQGVNKGKALNKKKRIDSVTADQTAALVAIQAYIDYVEKNGEEDSVPGINEPNNKQFFLNFGQLMCGSSMGDPLNRDVLDLNLNACRLNNIVRNLPQFSETFTCSEYSKMNNKTDCLI